jgi:hypothetical protein
MSLREIAFILNEKPIAQTKEKSAKYEEKINRKYKVTR